MIMQASVSLLVHIFLFCTLVTVTVLYSNEKHEKIIKGFYFASLKFVFYNFFYLYQALYCKEFYHKI